jgi:hypothetical protein
MAVTDVNASASTWVCISMPPVNGSLIAKRAAATIATSMQAP